jgi:hypothetical protein
MGAVFGVKIRPLFIVALVGLFLTYFGLLSSFHHMVNKEGDVPWSYITSFVVGVLTLSFTYFIYDDEKQKIKDKKEKRLIKKSILNLEKQFKSGRDIFVREIGWTKDKKIIISQSLGWRIIDGKYCKDGLYYTAEEILAYKE